MRTADFHLGKVVGRLLPAPPPGGRGPWEKVVGEPAWHGRHTSRELRALPAPWVPPPSAGRRDNRTLPMLPW